MKLQTQWLVRFGKGLSQSEGLCYLQMRSFARNFKSQIVTPKVRSEQPQSNYQRTDAREEQNIQQEGRYKHNDHQQEGRYKRNDQSHERSQHDAGRYNKYNDKQSQQQHDGGRFKENDQQQSYQYKERKQPKEMKEQQYQSQNPEWLKKLNSKGSLNKNMGKDEQDIQKILHALSLQQEGKYNITLLEYTQFLKNRQVLERSFLTQQIMNLYMKQLFKNEGLDDEGDDIFRPIYRAKRAKVSSILKSRPEVQNAIKVSLESAKSLGLDKIAGLFTFIIKTSYPLNFDVEKHFIKDIKFLIVDSKANQEVRFDSVSIIMKYAQKHVLEQRDEKIKGLYFDLVKSILPILDAEHQNISVLHISMMMKSLKIFNLLTADLAFKLIEPYKQKLSDATLNDLTIILNQIFLLDDLNFEKLDSRYELAMKFIFKEIETQIQTSLEEQTLKPYRLTVLLKILSNKKGLMPLNKFTDQNRLFKFIEVIYAKKKDETQLNDIIELVKTFQRYQQVISDDIIEIYKQKLDLFINDKDNMRNKINDNEIGKMVRTSIESEGRIVDHSKIDLLMTILIDRVKANFHQTKSRDEKTNQLKMVFSLLGNIKRAQIKIDPKFKIESQILTEMRDELSQIPSN